MVERGELKPKDVKNDTVIYFGSDGLPYEKQADDEGEVKCIEGEIPFDLPRDGAGQGLAIITCSAMEHRSVPVRRGFQLQFCDLQTLMKQLSHWTEFVP